MESRFTERMATYWISSSETERTKGRTFMAAHFKQSPVTARGDRCGDGHLGRGSSGYRISPNSTFNSMFDSDPAQTFSYLTQELSKRELAYLHVVEGKSDLPQGAFPLTPILRKLFDGTCMVNEGYDGKSAELALQEGLADLVSFGKLFLANPDLPERLKTGAGFNKPDIATFYVGDKKG